jgi:hypothetical protein
MQVDAAEICFIATHPAAGEHFGDFALRMKGDGLPYQFLATEMGYTNATKNPITVTNLNSLFNGRKLIDLTDSELAELASAVVKSCRHAKRILVDGCSPFSVKVLETMHEMAPEVKRIMAYYDNPETAYIPGYSENFAKIAKLANVLVFSLSTQPQQRVMSTATAPLEMEGKELIGLGYYRKQAVENFIRLRTHPEVVKEKRYTLFRALHREDRGEKLVVFFGGANETYIFKAFPAFLDRTLGPMAGKADWSNTIFILQQHGRAKTEYKNGDHLKLEEWCKRHPQITFVTSMLPYDDAVVIADVALYHQTGASLQFLLAGMNGMQVGDRFEDTPVRLGYFPSIGPDESELFVKRLSDPKREAAALGPIEQSIGIRADWYNRFRDMVLK